MLRYEHEEDRRIATFIHQRAVASPGMRNRGSEIQVGDQVYPLGLKAQPNLVLDPNDMKVHSVKELPTFAALKLKEFQQKVYDTEVAGVTPPAKPVLAKGIGSSHPGQGTPDSAIMVDDVVRLQSKIQDLVRRIGTFHRCKDVNAKNALAAYHNAKIAFSQRDFKGARRFIMESHVYADNVQVDRDRAAYGD